MFAALALAGCSTQKQPDFGQIGAVKGFIGGVVAEEPNAAVAARDVLSAGGTAADAAVATFFTMVATYPVAAGLGGGGVCVYYDSVTNTAETLDFNAGRPAGGGSVAVPGAVRGMALLHSRYGRLRWGQLISPGETLARFGQSVSRALAKRLEPLAGRLAQDPVLRKIYLRPDGSPLAEGDELVQVELAAALAQVRTKGVTDLYGGETGREFIAAAKSVGGAVTIEDLRDYRAVFRGVRKREFGNLQVYHPLPPPVSANALHALTGLSKGATDQAITDAHSGLSGSDEQGSAGVVAVDRQGSAVACSFTMYNEFGTATTVPSLGMALAPVDGLSRVALATVVAANEHVPQAFFGAAGTGGAVALDAVAQVTRNVLGEGSGLQQALEAPRRGPAGNSGSIEGESASTPFGKVQAFWCELGANRAPKSCEFRSDPRGYGLAAAEVF